MERPAHADRDTDRAERGRCFDTHEQVRCRRSDVTCLQGKYFIEFSCFLLCIKCKVLHKAEDQKGNRAVLGIIISNSPL